MVDKAHAATDRELVRMERHLSAIYNRASKELGETWKKNLAEVTKKLEPLQKAYEEAKASGDKDLIKKTGMDLAARKREMSVLDQHYKNLTEQLAQEMTHVNETAIAYVNGQLPKIYSLNYNSVSKDLSSQVKGVSFELVDAHTVKNLATTDKTLLPYKKVDGKKDVRWNTQRVNAEVLQGILQGESMDKVAERLAKVEDMNEKSAIRNARTSVTSAENKGRIDMLHDAEEKGVLTHKIWMATNDDKTRDWHTDLDGVELEIDEYFENTIVSGKSSFRDKILYPGDPDADPANLYNCRCTLVYKVVGFGENQNRAEESDATEQIYKYDPSKDISSANSSGTNVLRQMYDDHTQVNGLRRTSFSEANKIVQTVGADYSNLSVETANVFNKQIANLASEYDTPLQRIRTMTKEEAVFSQNTFARVTHNYSVDSAEMVINPVKCKDVSELSSRISELQQKGYCVKIEQGKEADYVVTHEFAHSIINMESPLSKNWVEADFETVKSARKEISAVYTEYIEKVSRIDSDFKQAELDYILGNGTSEKALEIKRELDSVKMSNYSLINADEFLAESFTNQKIGVASNPYAERAIAVLDKYFRR